MIFRVLILFSLFYVRASAQSPDSVPIIVGIDKFVLGASIAGFKQDLGYISGGKYTWNDTTTYTYTYCPLENSPVLINDVLFRMILLTFQDNQRLTGFSFIGMYANKPTPSMKEIVIGNHRSALKDYESLIRYMEAKWGKPGKRTIHDKLSYYSICEWTSTTSIMEVTLQYSFKDPRKFTSIHVSLRSLPPRQ